MFSNRLRRLLISGVSMRTGARSIVLATLLLITSFACMARDQTHPLSSFKMLSVSLSGDTCTLAAQSDDGVTYYATGWARDCPMRTGDSRTGYAKTYSSLFGPNRTELYFENGITNKGKKLWLHFTVSSQSQ